MATTTTAPQMIVCSGSSISTAVIMPPFGPQQQLQICKMWFCCHCSYQEKLNVAIATVTQQLPQPQMPFQASEFLFQNWASHQFVYMLVSVIVYASCFQVPMWMPFSPVKAQPLGFEPMQPLCASWWWFEAHTRTVLSGCSLHCFDEGDALGILVIYCAAIPSVLWGIKLWDLAESHQIPPPSLHSREGSSFPGFVPPDDMVDSKWVMDMKPDYSCNID